ncbi:MAG: hypothetical protein FWC75_06490 [Oscillospiraceae bacterium]|nr:hypothetical protein [Oscillospiraceae bacterium]
MKKMILIIALAALLMVMVGCDNNTDTSKGSDSVAIPTEASMPGTIEISALLHMVNGFLEFEEGWELDVAYADVWDDSEHGEILYVFDYGVFDIVLFADIETGAFRYGYVRTQNMMTDINTLFEVMSIAGAFLRALEPVEYEHMLLEVLQFGALETDDGAHVDFLELHDEVIESFGEIWGLSLQWGRVVNIFPIDPSLL